MIGVVKQEDKSCLVTEEVVVKFTEKAQPVAQAESIQQIRSNAKKATYVSNGRGGFMQQQLGAGSVVPQQQQIHAQPQP